MLSLLNSKLERNLQEDSKVQINTLLIANPESPVKELIKCYLSMSQNTRFSMMADSKYHHYF